MAEDDIARLYTFLPDTTIESAKVNAELNQLITTTNTKVGRGTTETITGAKTFTANCTLSGDNALSGINTFSHASTPIKTDKIAENTSAAGVTIDGTLLKDGGVEATGAISTTSTGGILISNIVPRYRWYETDAATDEKSWLATLTGGDLIIQTAADATPTSGVGNAIRLYRTGTTVDEIELTATLMDINGTINSSTGQVAGAWVVFNGTGTPAIGDSHNVSSITDNGTGDYTINFTTAFGTANYAALITHNLFAVGSQAINISSKIAASLRFLTYQESPADNSATGDPTIVSVICFGDQ